MILDPILDYFRGEAVTIPPMDGAFRPNRRLDDAPAWASLAAPDALASTRDGLLASSGNTIYSIAESGEATLRSAFPSAVTAMAASSAGEIAVGLESGRLVVDGQEVPLPEQIGCITALAFGADGALWLANGSATQRPFMWARDLLERGASGSLWKRAAGAQGFREVAGGLAFPYGLHVEAAGVLVSESWRHRLLRFDEKGGRTIVLDNLPGYPARLSPASGGGAWLALFAPRNRLVEFVLQERHYREDMLAQVPPAYWIAPALSSRASFLEPLQCGGIKTMGVHKPWSPSRSYGMVARLDPDMRPLFSLHSRADGARHGTVSAVEHAGLLIVASKGGDCLLAIDPSGSEAH